MFARRFLSLLLNRQHAREIHLADEITSEDIATAALNPQSATVDGQSATAHSIPDIIAAANHAAASSALAGASEQGGPRSGWSMLRPARVRPTGPV